MVKRLKRIVGREVLKLKAISESQEEPLDYKQASALGEYTEIILRLGKEERSVEDFNRLNNLTPDELDDLTRQVIEFSPWIKKGKKNGKSA